MSNPQKGFRANQFIAKQIGISRRKADTYIQNQCLKINGQQADFGQRVYPGDKIELKKDSNWQDISAAVGKRTILFYKPIFTLTTKFDPQGRETIYNRLPPEQRDLKPAGRLDYMSEGLLILSNDGDFLQKITHPKYVSKKEYLVALKKPLPKNFIAEVKTGIQLDDYLLNPVEINRFDSFDDYRYLKLQPNFVWYKFILTEGRNNQIRRICEVAGQKVQRLIRVTHGDFKISKELKNKVCLEV